MTDELGDVTMQSTIRQTTKINGIAATENEGAFQRQLIAELGSPPQQASTQANSTISHPLAGTPAANGNSSSSTPTRLDNLTANSERVVGQTPLYERLYGAPAESTNMDHSATSGTESVSIRRIRNFASAIRAPASIAAMELGTTTNTIIAFAGLETGWGQHIPASGGQNSHNLFGIKSHNNKQPSVTSQTTEYVDGQVRSMAQEFRSYQSIGESIEDFSRFLRTNPRYENALSHADNPERFIHLVHDAGYATDPDYADKVIAALEQLDNITKKIGAIGIGWR